MFIVCIGEGENYPRSKTSGKIWINPVIDILHQDCAYTFLVLPKVLENSKSWLSGNNWNYLEKAQELFESQT